MVEWREALVQSWERVTACLLETQLVFWTLRLVPSVLVHHSLTYKQSESEVSSQFRQYFFRPLGPPKSRLFVHHLDLEYALPEQRHLLHVFSLLLLSSRKNAAHAVVGC